MLLFCMVDILVFFYRYDIIFSDYIFMIIIDYGMVSLLLIEVVFIICGKFLYSVLYF